MECLDEKPEIESTAVTAVTVGPWGNYSKATPFPNDPVEGKVMGISIFTGKRFPFDTVVLGIAVTYGGAAAIPHGTTTGQGITETKCPLQPEQYIGKVEGRSFNMETEGSNLIFQLGFQDTSGRTICSSPTTTSGISKSGPTISTVVEALVFISGSITDSPLAIGSLTFNFEEKP